MQSQLHDCISTLLSDCPPPSTIEGIWNEGHGRAILRHTALNTISPSIYHEIALALVYLHSNDIIHRNLSSNNVLIIAKRRAKVTNFGASKL